MKLTELECPNCGAGLDNFSEKIIVCKYCGSSIYNAHYQEPQQQQTADSTNTSANDNTQYDNGYGRTPIIPIIRLRPPHGRPPMGGGRPPMGRSPRGGGRPHGGGRRGR